MKNTILTIIILIVVLGIIYGGYILNRHWNWSMGYEDMVEEKVIEMVKVEALREGK